MGKERGLLGGVIFALFLTSAWAASKSISEVMNNLFPDTSSTSGLNKGLNYYDKRIRPNSGESPTTVTVSAYILDIFDVDVKRHEFTTQLYFRQSWLDPRLKFDLPGVKHITFDGTNANKLFIPDTFMVNERSSIRHEMTVPNIYTRLSSDGQILRSVRITVTANCPQNLAWFPFDTNICGLEIESYSYSMADMAYKWKMDTNKKADVGVAPDAWGSINQEIVGYRSKTMEIALSTGNYSRLAIEFLMRRSPGRFILELYIPAIVFVLIVFVTMGVGELHFRVLLSSACLMGSLLLPQLSNEMPKVTYKTALDCYLLMCNVLISCVLIVNILMYHLLKPSARMRIKESDEGKEMDLAGTKKILYTFLTYCRYSFPFLFLLFNAVYWVKACNHSHAMEDYQDFILMKEVYSF